MKNKAFIYIIIAGLLWGTSGVFVHFLAPLGLSALQMASIRGTVAAVFMVMYALIKDRNLFKTNIKQLALHIGGGLAMYLTGSCYYLAIQASSVSTAVMLMYTAPIIVMIFSVMFLGERLNIPKVISVILMFAGCCFVSGVIGGFEFSVSGILLGFASGFAYSAYNIFTKIQMKNKCNPISASMYCFVFMMLTSFIVTPPGGTIEIAVSNPLYIPLIIGCGLCTCIFPYFLYTLALKTLPAGTASSLAIVEPMSATLYSVLFLGEVLGLFQGIGILLVIGAVFILSKSEK